MYVIIQLKQKIDPIDIFPHQIHDTLNSHTLVTIKEHLKASFAEEQRYCHDHKTEIYSLGCERCYEMFCSECVNTPTVCGKGNKINKIHSDFLYFNHDH